MDTDRSQSSLQLPQNDDETDSDGDAEQDIEEVWSRGCHADISGGWSLADGDEHPLSHGPLVWMIREAQKAGLPIDPEKMVQLKCCEDYNIPFKETMTCLRRSSKTTLKQVSSSDYEICFDTYTQIN